MQVDFSEVQEVEDHMTIPEGSYVCRVAEVRQGTTRDGSPRWSMRLEVVEGDLAGKTAAWDGLNWSERGMPRVKQVLGIFGFDVSGILELQPDDLVGRRVRAQVFPELREDPTTGDRRKWNRVPYRGYEAVEQDATPF